MTEHIMRLNTLWDWTDYETERIIRLNHYKSEHIIRLNT
jgi:hypothetical protein